MDVLHDRAIQAPAVFPSFRLAGTHRQIGRQFGEATAPLIRHHLDSALERLETRGSLTRQDALAAAMTYRPYVQAHAPFLDEEVVGVAEGAGLTLEEAYLLQLRAEAATTTLAAPAPLLAADDDGPDECTSVVALPELTADRQPLAAHNADLPAFYREVGVVLEIVPDDGPAVLMLTGRPGLLHRHERPWVGRLRQLPDLRRLASWLPALLSVACRAHAGLGRGSRRGGAGDPARLVTQPGPGRHRRPRCRPRADAYPRGPDRPHGRRARPLESLHRCLPRLGGARRRCLRPQLVDPAATNTRDGARTARSPRRGRGAGGAARPNLLSGHALSDAGRLGRPRRDDVRLDRGSAARREMWVAVGPPNEHEYVHHSFSRTA